METRLTLLALLAAFAVPISAGTLWPTDAKIVATFDADREGWRVQGGEPSHQQGNEDRGGYLQIIDKDSSNMYLTAPEPFVGDLSSFEGGMLSFDARQIEPPGGRAWSGFGCVTIIGGGHELRVDLALDPATRTWKKYSVPLMASDWGVGPETWRKVLSDVKTIRVSVEAVTPVVETVGFDNFQLSVRPDMIASEEFQRHDTNGDGRLNADEFPSRLQGYWKYIDTNHDGWVNRSEATRTRAAISDEKVP